MATVELYKVSRIIDNDEELSIGWCQSVKEATVVMDTDRAMHPGGKGYIMRKEVYDENDNPLC